MNDGPGGIVPGTTESLLRVEVVWGIPGGLGPGWEPVGPIGAGSAVLPSPHEVETLYAAAAAEPPLNEAPAYAELFANIYDLSVRTGQVLTASSRHEGRLASLAYGHFWTWAEQNNPWASELRASLGAAAGHIEWTYALNLLARDPRMRDSGIGRRTLEAWLGGIGPYGCWLQTDDIVSPARRLYEKLGFSALGHGPEAPNGEPGLVMFRPPS